MTTHPHLEGLIRKWREIGNGEVGDAFSGPWYQCADELEAALAALPGGGEWVMVRKEAIDWLNGEAEFECPPDRYFRGEPPRYWWRSVFREKAGLTALPTPNPHEADRK